MTLPDLPIDADSLRDLGRVFPGCDFGDAPRRAFLGCMTDRDVQAAPGSGKTTLLVAKLDLLAGRWSERQRGICVVSHTNAARREVEERLRVRPSGSVLLQWPHFVGTITAFVHTFLAMPLVRGMGWPVTRIDDDVHRAAAIRLGWTKATLNAQRGMRARDVERWIASLTLASNFGRVDAWPPGPIAVRSMDKMPGAGTPSRKELEEIKAALIGEGVYSFADMTSLAQRALTECPVLAERLAARFPIVFVDEAQDTGREHLALIDAIFRGRSIIQRLGDRNQTIYSDAASGDEGGGWEPGEGHVDLGESRRFGRGIAAFATRLAARTPQKIDGARDAEGRHALLLFDKASALRVLPRFAELVSEECPTCSSPAFEAWALASRHRPSGSGTNFPVSLCDFAPGYRPRGGAERAGELLVAAVRDAVARARAGDALHEQGSRFAAAIIALLDDQGVAAPDAPHWTPTSVWKALDAANPGGAASVRRVFRDAIIDGGLDTADGWSRSLAALLRALSPLVEGTDLTPSALRRTEYCEPGEGGGAIADDRNRFVHRIDGREVVVRLGSIAGAKGQTHDATLVVETWIRTHDVRLALASAFGNAALPTSATPFKYKAVTNVFVGSTRPRHLLCLAVEGGALKRAEAARAAELGWRVLDLR